MNKELKKLMKNFESDSTGTKRYNDFLFHCFTTFEKSIKLNKSKKPISSKSQDEKDVKATSKNKAKSKKISKK